MIHSDVSAGELRGIPSGQAAATSVHFARRFHAHRMSELADCWRAWTVSPGSKRWERVRSAAVKKDSDCELAIRQPGLKL
jgi:hypothetical protein